MSDRLAQRTEQFREALQQIESVETLPYDEKILADRRTLNAGKLLVNALYVPDRKGLGASEDPVLEFYPDPARLQGATDSMHGVIFGELHTYEDKAPVAVKPFDSAKALAIREYMAYKFMSSQGYPSLLPLGIVACNDAVFLLTEDKPSCKTFDNLRWSPKALKEGEMGSEQLELMRQTGEQLGKMHANGITHGDAQPKNVMLDGLGNVGFIDYESLQYTPRELGSEMMMRRMTDDVLVFYSKLHRFYGYCRNEEMKARFHHFDEQFLTPYTNSFYESNTWIKPQRMRQMMVHVRTNLMKLVIREHKDR